MALIRVGSKGLARRGVFLWEIGEKFVRPLSMGFGYGFDIVAYAVEGAGDKAPDEILKTLNTDQDRTYGTAAFG